MHLKEPIEALDKLLRLVKLGGYVFLDEAASNHSVHFCRGKCDGYNKYVEGIKWQENLQNSNFLVGFDILDHLQNNGFEILSTYLYQPVLRSNREKSLIRLAAEEVYETYKNHFGKKAADSLISSLKEFENDKFTYGLYSRHIGIFAKKMNYG